MNKSNGLPSNKVYHIIQDSSAFLWMVTEMGLVRYDGQELLIFDQNNGLACTDNFEISNSAKNNIIALGGNGRISEVDGNNFFVDSLFIFNAFVSEYILLRDGRIAVSSFGDGIKIRDEDELISIHKEDGLAGNYVSFIWENEGRVYCISKKGLSRINRDYSIDVLFEFEKSIHFARALQNVNGDVLFTGNSELFRFDKNEKLTSLKNATELTSKSPNKLQFIDGKYLLSTYKGMNFFTIENDELIVEKTLLENKIVTSALRDHEGNLWVSTLESGVIKVSDENFTLLTNQVQVFSLHVGSVGEILFGLNKSTFGAFINDSISYTVLNAKNKYSIQKIRKITSFNNRLWLEQDGGISSFDGENLKYHRTGVASICLYNDRIIVGNKQKCYLMNFNFSIDSLVEGDGNNSLIGSFAKPLLNSGVTFFKVHDSLLYIGTEKGIFTMNQAFRVEKLLSNKYDGFTNDIAFDQDEIIIAYNGGGVLYIKGSDTLRINYQSGLSSNYAYKVAMIEDKIFIATNRGLNMIDKSSLLSRKISINVVLEKTKINDFLLVNDFLFVATDVGLYRSVDFLSEPKDFSIPLQSNFVLVNDSIRFDLTNLNYDENNLLFNINYISYSDKKVSKYYKLNEDDWRPFEGQLLFKDLASGSYELKLRAKSDGHNSEILEYVFRIHPPWWATWWFRVSLTILTLLIIYWFFKVRILTYNRDIIREMLQLILAKLKKEKFIVLKNIKDGSKTKITLPQLKYIESSKNYVTLYSVDHKITVRITLKEVYNMISQLDDSFFRCHRSYVVNTKRITAVHAGFIKIQDDKIPIGYNYLESAKEKLELLSNAK